MVLWTFRDDIKNSLPFFVGILSLSVFLSPSLPRDFGSSRVYQPPHPTSLDQAAPTTSHVDVAGEYG